MSTRESMRRELRELAKLAEAKRQEQSKTPRSSGEWHVEEAADAPTPAPPAEMADEAILGTAEAIRPLDPPSWAASATVSPALPGSPSLPGGVETSTRPSFARRRWLMVGVAAVVLVGAGVAGRKLHGSPAQAAAASAPPPAVAEAPSAPAAPEPARTADSPAPAAAPAPTAATVPASPPSRRSATPRPGRPAHGAAIPAKALAQAKAAAAPGAANHADSLDDLMRKAVNSPK